jgi:hypothetical protein
LRMEAARSTEMLVPMYQSLWRHTRED